MKNINILQSTGHQVKLVILTIGWTNRKVIITAG